MDESTVMPDDPDPAPYWEDPPAADLAAGTAAALAHSAGTGAGAERSAFIDAAGAGLVPDLEGPASDDFDGARKLPRHLHIWFALGLGLIALLTLGAQAWLSRGTSGPSAAAHPVHDPASEPAPPLHVLQRELSREKGVDGGGIAGGPLGRLPAAQARAPSASRMIDLATAAAAPADVAARAEAAIPAEALDLPPGLLAAPANAARREPAVVDEEQARVQATVAGSRILALSHAGAAEGGWPDATASAPGGAHADKLHQLAALLHSVPDLLSAVPAALSLGRAADAAVAGTGVQAEPPLDTAAAARQAKGRFSWTAAPDGPMVAEGTPISCVLLNELRSDLPGMIVAQVAEDVYDSVSGQRRLIPRGTRLIGRYENQVGAGQQRLMASFHRMILPGGASIDLQRMEAADRLGSAGLEDQVDTHFWRRFGQAFMTAGLARAAQRGDGTVGSSAPGGGVLPGPDATGQILVDTARTGLQSVGGLAPTLIIRRGSAFQVMVNRDLILPEVDAP
ncbi:MAG: TrbI/VirB10 family protein [Pseudomonadota bacterium]|nr:TrbI/VirB10 family protein [Pseudomonadota bacterium]